ncbi:GL10327 [Drosophila persimilis]|uniref:GL10327 n=1 Tax=Drosophila persimilis TaxID=7234 RepID=B4H9I9_DROPE|nr:GL10327 [Drosophila persimilis]
MQNPQMHKCTIPEIPDPVIRKLSNTIQGNSETYRAIQEDGGYSGNYGNASPQEVTIPVQTRVYQPNRLVPGKKPVSAPVSRPPYNVVNTHDENIRQSGSFNRLMYSVIGATEY